MGKLALNRTKAGSRTGPAGSTQIHTRSIPDPDPVPDSDPDPYPDPVPDPAVILLLGFFGGVILEYTRIC